MNYLWHKTETPLLFNAELALRSGILLTFALLCQFFWNLLYKYWLVLPWKLKFVLLSFSRATTSIKYNCSNYSSEGLGMICKLTTYYDNMGSSWLTAWTINDSLNSGYLTAPIPTPSPQTRLLKINSLCTMIGNIMCSYFFIKTFI